MIRSELADELGVTPSVVRKWLLIHTQLTGRPLETRLDEQTVTDMQRARELMGRLDSLDAALGRVEQRQGALEVNQEEMAKRLEEMIHHLRNLLARRTGAGEASKEVRDSPDR